MGEQPSRSTPPRARPVAELALEGLAQRSREISRRWAIALIVEGPVESLGGLPLEYLARDAPPLIGALLASLSSDAELERLLGGGRSAESPASQLASMAGASDVEEIVNAVEALRGVLWEELQDELSAVSRDSVRPRALSELSDRLAHVCAAILPQALAASGPATANVPPPVSPKAFGPATAKPRTDVVIIDERAEQPHPGPPDSLPEPPSPGGEIQIRDERGDEGPAAWIGSIGRQLEQVEEGGGSFAVLLVEMRPAAPLKQAQIAWEPLEEQLVEELSSAGGGTMTRERAGRYWLVAPGTDRIGAGALSARLAGALSASARERMMGVSVAIGTAICPEDGRQASALAAHADVSLFAARADGNLATGTVERGPEA